MFNDTNATSILKRTKKIIQTSRNFRELFFGKGSDLLESELPLIKKDKYQANESLPNSLSNLSSKYNYNLNRKHLLGSNNIYSLRYFYPIHNKTEISNNFSVNSLEVLYRKKRKQLNELNTSLDRFNNDIFNNESYANLEYDESKIFNNKERIKMIIEDKIKYFSTNKNKNYIDILTKTINNQNKHFKITLKSIIVKFIDISTNSLTFEFTLPFALLPIFYYKGFENFKIILAKIVTFNSTYTNITIDDTVISKILGESGNQCFRQSSNDINSTYISPKISPKKQRKSLEINSSPNNNGTGAKITIQKRPKILEINGPQNVKDDNENFTYNVYKFSWVTPKQIFNVDVVMPLILFEETSKNIIITKYIDYELLFYIYKKNFSAWDFYLINYLFSYKMFRKIIEKILSKNVGYSQQTKISNHLVNLQKEKKWTYNINSTIQTYLFTDKCVNYITRVNSIHMKISITDFKNSKCIVHFNFSQMMKMYKCTKIIPISKIDKVLKKFLDINYKKETIAFNYEIFDSLTDEGWEDYLKSVKEYLIDEDPKTSLDLAPQITVGSISVTQESNCGYSVSLPPKIPSMILRIEPPTLKFHSVEENGYLKLKATEILSKVIRELEAIDMMKWCKVFKEEFQPKLINQNLNLSLNSNSSFLGVQRNSQQYKNPLLSPRRCIKKNSHIKI